MTLTKLFRNTIIFIYNLPIAVSAESGCRKSFSERDLEHPAAVKRKKGGRFMKFTEFLNNIDTIVEKEKYDKKKKELFDTKEESPEELYIKSCDGSEE